MKCTRPIQSLERFGDFHSVKLVGFKKIYVLSYSMPVFSANLFRLFYQNMIICHLCRQHCFTLTQCQSVSTFEREVRNSLSTLEQVRNSLITLEPCSTDSLGHQHHTKKLSPKIALHFKVLCKSKATLPLKLLFSRFYIMIIIFPCFRK